MGSRHLLHSPTPPNLLRRQVRPNTSSLIIPHRPMTRSIVCIWLLLAGVAHGQPRDAPLPGNTLSDRASLVQAVATGWNTWDNRSIFSHVRLPQGFALQLHLVDTLSGRVLDKVFTGNKVEGSERVRTLAHTPDGIYTAFTLQWNGFDLLVESAARADHLDVLITPEPAAANPGWVAAVPAFLYGKTGSSAWENRCIRICADQDTFFVYLPQAAGGQHEDQIRFALDGPVAFSTRDTTVAAVQQRIRQAEATWHARRQAMGATSRPYEVIENALNWLVVYDPAGQRVVTPVSRPWSYGWGGQQAGGGYVQFCWDNFFVAYTHSLESKVLAFNEVFQLTRLIDELGFVPNYAGPGGEYSRDRSQPPVGSIIVKEIYKRYPEQWFLKANFDQLLRWNRWWPAQRDIDGYLVWGSQPYTPVIHPRQRTQHNHAAASNESGLDNTPMYDGVPFDTLRHVLPQADVGLMSLYIADCHALAEIAQTIGRTAEATELQARARHYRGRLQTLWHEDIGLFLNRRLDTAAWNYSISPTHFYLLLAQAATPEQARRMIEEHFYNPDEFGGDFILPSIAHNDHGYTGRDYWRGSIWAPMNFLVYLGLRNYNLPQARSDLADKSLLLLLKNWDARGQVLENYHAETGTYPGYRSEYFYHWGALLGMIALIEHGQVPAPEVSLE
ncbi:MAG: hypothetical protein OHK0039_27680 [Bacteroidia bacterium]